MFENATNLGSASDACGITTVTYIDVAAGTCPTVVTRTWTIGDACGNTSTCTQTINVDDTIAPTITACAVTRTIEGCNVEAITGPVYSATTAASSEAVFENATNLGSASDACGITTVTYIDVAAGTCPTVVTRTWTIGDACGNTSTCSQTINVNDTTAPTIISCAVSRSLEGCNVEAITDPPYSAVPALSSEAVFENQTNGGNASDACGITAVFYSDVAAGTCPTIVTRTWVVRDACGNLTTCNQMISVDDTTNPTIAVCAVTRTVEGCNAGAITNPPYSAITALSSEAVFENATNLGSASDACGITTVTYIDASAGTCPTIVTRTWTVGDACGNTSTCNQTIIVNDTTNPVIVSCAVTRNVEGCNTGAITGPAYSAVLASSSEAVFENATNLGVASDACGITTVTYIDVASGACPIVVARTWTVIDACGHSASCTQTINVTDTTPPVFTFCPASSTINCPATPQFGIATAIDACDPMVIITFANITVQGTCPAEYSITRTWTAVDDCGNSASCSATITVQDTIAPAIHCPADLVLNCDANSNYPALINAWLATATASDMCDANVMITNNYDGMTIPNFSCQGGLVVTFTATDDCGNTATCTSTITKPCFTIESWVYLEGSATNPNGLPSYTIPMRTTLNNLRVLPGQTLLDPFLGPKYTPAGQPYNIAPWNYPGAEGSLYDSGGNPMFADAGYPPTVTDWVLVSIRLDSAGTGGPVCQAAALLHKDGRIQFVEPLDCCGVVESTSYYLVIEHRNHLIVMSDSIVSFVGHKLTYDFRHTQSWEDPIFAGFDLFARQKEIIPGTFAMFAGNGNQTPSLNADTDINFDDRSYWESQNGQVGQYRIGDYNLNGDTNFNDRITWERNNGKFTSVPRN